MAISLIKGEKIDVGLSKITVGLGWDPQEGSGHDFDLDASAFLLSAGRKLVKEEHFIFYNNLCGRGHSGNQCKNSNCTNGEFGVMHTGDDPDGKSSDGDDDESLIVDLSLVPAEIEEINFVVTISDYEARRQNFGQVRNSYIRIVDNSSGDEIAKYELGEDFSIETGIEFGRLYKRSDKWRFEASGVGYKEDLSFFLSKYFTGEIIK